MKNTRKPRDKGKSPGIFSLLQPYRKWILLLLLLTLLGNGINLLLPKIIANAIDAYPDHYILGNILKVYLGSALAVFLFTWLQGFVQIYTSEKVARNLRTSLSLKISKQSSSYIEKANPARLLTNLTADVDSIKTFVSQAIVSIVSSVFIIIGACLLLFSIDWKLALTIVAIVPIIGVTFSIVLKKVRAIFIQSRAVVDRLNKIINESILGAALIRVINSQQPEYAKFLDANTKAKDFGMAILKLFATLIPIIVLTANLATLSILTLGGHFVIQGDMTLGDFTAFNSYLAMLIFPILVIGFMSNVIAQATASYQRIQGVLHAPEIPDNATVKDALTGAIELQHVALRFDEKYTLKDINFKVENGTSLAVIGPTAAGKTQLLYLLTGLMQPSEGKILFNGIPIENFVKEDFYRQVGFVFQDSILFNMSIRENIAFSDQVTDEYLEKAIATAELKDFIDSLPDKLNTIVSERGTSLSGGQKQRLMLARALAVNPKVLLLDDFTARVDTNTETRILNNLRKNYPGITLISVTQKISTAELFDQIVVLMEGEIVAQGVHRDLMKESLEYVQIYNSQQSTSNYELQPQ